MNFTTFIDEFDNLQIIRLNQSVFYKGFKIIYRKKSFTIHYNNKRITKTSSIPECKEIINIIINYNKIKVA